MTAVEIVPRRGLRLEHARHRKAVPGLRCSESPPEVYVVTFVNRTTVYYGDPDRPRDQGGRKGRRASHYIAREAFATIVGKVIENEGTRR